MSLIDWHNLRMKRQRIINCVAQLPVKVELVGESNDFWKIGSVTGSSALYSSVQYLQQEGAEKYEQHVVGWTGEITREDAGTGAMEEAAAGGIIGASDTTTSGTHPEFVEDDPLYLTGDQIQGISVDLQRHFDKISAKNEQENASTVHPVWLLRRNQSRWRGFAENVIWPTFHYILNPASEGDQENNWWYDYVKFNEAYAQAIGEIYRPGDIIWIHDYYLMLLPQLLRMKFMHHQDQLTIAYFHHSPWPSNEYFRCLPRRKQILDGLLGANRICFQNEQFARHFVSSCKRLLDLTAKRLKNDEGIDQHLISAYGGDLIVDSLPIGVNTKQLLEDALKPDITKKVEAIKQAYQNKKVIIGRDRLDSVRGVLQKLRAFEMFMAMYPNWRDKVVLIQVSSPTANRNSPHIIRLEQQVNELVNSINSQYGNLNFSPVQHYYMRIPKDVYLSLLRVADVCLITSVRDGMNTTALEYVTIQSHNKANTGGNPLILSEFSGSSTLLKDAIVVNPWDSVAVAKSINMALNMDTDQKIQLENKLWSEVPTIQDWTEKFIQTSLKISADINNDGSNAERKITPALNRPVLLENYKAAQRRLFLFDYDGTLTPIVQDPSAAIPTARLYGILTKLLEDPKNQIWIISGRDQQFLNKWMGSKLPQMGLSAEHGCFIKDVNTKDWINLTEKVDMSWQAKVGEVMQEFTDKTPGSFIERKKVALTWHYRRAAPELGEFHAGELKQKLLTFTDDYGLEVMDGKANIEVRPRFVNKGEIVKSLVWHKHGDPKDFLETIDTSKLSVEDMPDFILCLGDDFTDEDMFRELNTIEDTWKKNFPENTNKWGHHGVYPVTVGSASKKTVAKAHLTDPQQVLDTLGLLVGNVSLFQSAGTVELDARGHVKNSESSLKSEINSRAYVLKKTNSSRSLKNLPNSASEK